MEKTVEVEGMHCKSCAAGIETFLKSQDGIEDAEVSYDNGKIEIEYTKAADLETAWKQVSDMGYEVQNQ